MKTRKYLACTVTTHGGTIFSNPLKLSEIRFVKELAENNDRVVVKITETNEAHYKSMFGN